mmetsp:Transcript_38606/g.46716  ORF Transcript_38606/g.46716 Transcript_38606/m.46716 type:complete len:299 (-) Transcript_38606:778-1674(-)|eukprot:CAMPEP_0197862026 /NCGR_PEP_ID=MMETSP1438-20131217/38448_1 /TAXON_ID=1461541 /ORGANISM="Pterosperma sp., Strain CCMP1384" /LENGTH=298 /DNA_ID=CAMNT_0043479419 /DNA_START=229 /DNA_END=1125 /DNA_ORIENTATION=-
MSAFQDATPLQDLQPEEQPQSLAFTAALDESASFDNTPVASVPVQAATTTIPEIATSYGTDTSFGAPTGSMSGFGSDNSNTLHEDVWTTFKRDLYRVGGNLKVILIPWRKEDSSAPDYQTVLRDWDLWGPFAFVLLLAVTLSAGSKDPSTVFSIVFTVLTFGAVVLNLNVLLLGGNIVFLQSLSLIGYCIFPMDIAALFCLLWGNVIYRSLLLLVGVAWACSASIPFLGAQVPADRRFLAVYPIVLLFISIAWLALVSSAVVEEHPTTPSPLPSTPSSDDTMGSGLPFAGSGDGSNGD